MAPVRPAHVAIEAPEGPRPARAAPRRRHPRLVGQSHEKSFQAGWEHEAEDHTADEAFERFFSDDVEPEPTQQWILAG